MITGAVMGNRDPRVQLLVRGPNSLHQPIDFVVDTGFSGFLALPQHRSDAFALRQIDVETIILSDGSSVQSQLYEAIVVWDGQERTVSVNTLEGDPLIGTSLLFDHEVTIRFVNGGCVTIERLP